MKESLFPGWEPLDSVKILVVGDAILDKYLIGDSDRLSPEAPVPVVKIKRKETRLGGAANVALNISSLGCKVSLLSCVGNDESGSELVRLLEEGGVSPYLQISNSFPTILKCRVIARNQQMLRTDFEGEIDSASLNRMEVTFSSLCSSFDAIVFSDYGKGNLKSVSKLIQIAKNAGCQFLLVDPKGNDFSKYSGATAITPNKSELEKIVGHWKSENELIDKAQTLRKSLAIEKLLLTRSEEGMTLFDQTGQFDVKAQAREVFDVSGAGDTVIAVLSSFLAAGFEWKCAINLANKAGGIVVGKFGTAVIDKSELYKLP